MAAIAVAAAGTLCCRACGPSSATSSSVARLSSIKCCGTGVPSQPSLLGAGDPSRPLHKTNDRSSSRGFLSIRAVVADSGAIGGGSARKTASVAISRVSNPSRSTIGSSASTGFASGTVVGPVHAAIAETTGDDLKWWEKGAAPNISDIHSTEEFLEALSASGDKLVVVEFYATWCGSCRALYPKFCKLATENSDVNFLKVNIDKNRPMCKSLNVKVLPFFHLYRGTEGRLDTFSCSLSKIQRLRDAISKHHDGCEDCAPPELLDEIFGSLLLGRKSID